MDDTAKGFQLGDAGFFPWGTRFDAVVRDSEDTGYSSRTLRCAEALGFTTLSAEIAASQPDRPILNVTYQLASDGTAAKDVLARLVIRLGAPNAIDRDELSPYASSSDHVVLYATWTTRDEISVGLSIYGAPRATEFGDSLGALYLGWGDLDAAAAPWLADWQAANEAVARDAQSPGEIETFTVAYDMLAGNEDDPHRIANRCLHTPDLLDTPEPIARKLGEKDFALWSDASGQRWHLSTRAVTVVLGRRGTSLVKVASIEPARGGGSESIDVGPWWVRDAWKSRAIEAAVHTLERVPGLTIERSSGYDV